MRGRRLAAFAVSGALAAAVSGGTVAASGDSAPTFSATVLPGAGGEPNVSISPNGATVLVSGLDGKSPATLYRSTDGGASFTEISPDFSSTGGGDWDMRFLDDQTVVATDLGMGQFFVHRSEDAGSTWTTTKIQMDVYDRPWLEHFGTDKVYVVAKGFDGIPYLFTSIDGGRSFGSPPLPVLVYGTGVVPAEAGGTSPTPADLLVSGMNAYLDHITVDPVTGDLYVLYGIESPRSYGPAHPLGVADRLYVAHLEGGTMVSRPVHLGEPGESSISGFNWMTIDSAGTLYVLANGSIAGRHSARLSYSKDHGASWSPLVDLGPAGGSNVYGSIAGGDPGVLSLVYLRGTLANPSEAQDWYAEVARVTGADTSVPAVTIVRPVAAAVHTADICFDGILCGLPGFGENRDLLDYIWNAIDSAGRAYAVVASDGPASGGASGVSVILLRQTGGAFHGPGAPS